MGEIKKGKKKELLAMYVIVLSSEQLLAKFQTKPSVIFP
jgi:hypothetical protein